MKKWFGRDSSVDKPRTQRGADPALPLKIRARRRLIGAVTLALTAVIVVPMFFGTEPRSLNPNIPIDIPDKNTPFAPKLEPVKSLPSKVAESAADVSSASNVAPEVKTVEAKPTEAKPTEPKLTEPRPAESKTTEVKPTESKTTEPQLTKSPVAASQSSAPDLKQPEKTSEKKVPEKKVSEKSAPEKKVAVKYGVQLAAYATNDKAEVWVKKLKAAGISAYTEKIKTSSGDRIRVRTGPYATQQEAEKVLKRVKTMGASEARLVYPS